MGLFCFSTPRPASPAARPDCPPPRGGGERSEAGGVLRAGRGGGQARAKPRRNWARRRRGVGGARSTPPPPRFVHHAAQVDALLLRAELRVAAPRVHAVEHGALRHVAHDRPVRVAVRAEVERVHEPPRRRVACGGRRRSGGEQRRAEVLRACLRGARYGASTGLPVRCSGGSASCSSIAFSRIADPSVTLLS